MKVKSQQVKKEILKTLELEKPENSNLDTDDEDDQISLDSDQEVKIIIFFENIILIFFQI